MFDKFLNHDWVLKKKKKSDFRIPKSLAYLSFICSALSMLYIEKSSHMTKINSVQLAKSPFLNGIDG